MIATARTRTVLERLLPLVLTGVEADLRTALGPHGPAAVSLIPRARQLQRLAVDLTYECARADHGPDRDTLAPFAGFGRTAADRGLTTDILRLGISTTYTTSLRIALDEVTAAERPALMPLVSWTARLGPLIEQAEVDALLTGQRERLGRRWFQREVARGLLTGRGRPAGHAPAYAVAVVGPADPGRAHTVASIERTLAEADVLMVPRPRFVVVLHPLPAVPDPVAAIGGHPPVPPVDALGGVWAAHAHGRADALAGAFREAVTAWHLVRSRRYPPGRYDLFSVLTERIVSRDDEAAHRLRGLLVPLAGSPTLIDTLRHWLLGDADRRAVATRLHVHPNTLDRRLRQIEERTGLSVTRYGSLHLLHLALAATPMPAAGRSASGSASDRRR